MFGAKCLIRRGTRVFSQILVETVYNHDDKPEVWAGSAADTIRTFMLLEKLDFYRNQGPSILGKPFV